MMKILILFIIAAVRYAILISNQPVKGGVDHGISDYSIFGIGVCRLPDGTVFTAALLAAAGRAASRMCGSAGRQQWAYRTDYIDEILRNELTLLKQSGQDAEAVKRLREQTGWSLLEAKRYIDRL